MIEITDEMVFLRGHYPTLQMLAHTAPRTWGLQPSCIVIQAVVCRIILAGYGGKAYVRGNRFISCMRDGIKDSVHNA